MSLSSPLITSENMGHKQKATLGEPRHSQQQANGGRESVPTLNRFVVVVVVVVVLMEV